MRWSKVVLIFQAIVTLIIGMVFLSSFIKLDNISTDKIKASLNEGYSILDKEFSPSLRDLKQRYIIATYVLLIVFVIEILIIARLTS